LRPTLALNQRARGKSGCAFFHIKFSRFKVLDAT
jgi:hypothetical protein